MEFQKTKWVFIVAGKKSVDPNHVWDVFDGIKMLHSKGVPQKNIVFFIENNLPDIYEIEKNKILAEFSDFDSYYHEKPLREISRVLSQDDVSTFENCIVFISSHGSPDGISSIENLKPYVFTSIFDALCYSNIIIYFGQCYSGIYNYINLEKIVTNPKKMILVGASGFYPSISKGEKDGNLRNIFLKHLFEWYSEFSDIDGDGKFSIMDSFKYAAVKTDSEIQNTKAIYFLEGLRDKDGLFKKDPKKMDDDEKEAVGSILMNSSLVHEPWILNAKEAVNLFFN